MKPALLACLVGLCLVGTGLPVGAQGQPPAPQPAQQAQPAAQPSATPPSQANPQPQASARPAVPSRAERRRRSSYAACNRASHQRNLRGGVRRRFLIRCRLGYERTRTQPAVQSGGGQPPAARRP